MAEPVSIRIAKLIWAGVFFAIAAGLFAMAAKFASSDAELATMGGRAQGTVIEVVKDGARHYRPIVAFPDQTGQRRQFASKVSSKPAAYEKGERVTVLYDPANPADAMIDSFFDRYFTTVGFGFMGTVMALFGAFVLVGLRR